MTITTIDTNM